MPDLDDTTTVMLCCLVVLCTVCLCVLAWPDDSHRTAQENRIRHECRLKVVDARPAGWFSTAQDAWLCPDGTTWYISTIKK